ncbi:hypothetical protein SBOR_4513 [Sclerotinia borealis F-4128]|uniref:Uncharacterized protein n=1 Tax=Sclerotinia borealis (strain F-4128) TaxID=1432307 RepID=W9CEB0_SCLBF|nr:hypothetical protein SBOR_4513 [Sclerotinia borealis F-4128]
MHNSLIASQSTTHTYTYTDTHTHTRDEDQSEAGPFGTPRSLSNDGTTTSSISNNLPIFTSTSLPLPATAAAIISPSSNALPDLHPHLVESPYHALDTGAVTGIIIAVIIILFLLLALTDIFLLSSRIQVTFSKKIARLRRRGDYRHHHGSLSQSQSQSNAKNSFDSDSTININPLPTIPDPAYFSKDIRPSEKRFTSRSGYSSRYSRSMSFDSGVGGLGVLGEEMDGDVKSFVSRVEYGAWDGDGDGDGDRNKNKDEENENEKGINAMKSQGEMGMKGYISAGLDQGDMRAGLRVENGGDGDGDIDDRNEEWYSQYAESINTESDDSTEEVRVENQVPDPPLTSNYGGKQKILDEESSIGMGGEMNRGVLEIQRGVGVLQRSKTDTNINTYNGRIKAGMGVQKRHTMNFVREVEEVRRAMARQEVMEERDRVNFLVYSRFWKEIRVEDLKKGKGGG